MNQYSDVIFLNSLLTNILFLPFFLAAVFLAFYVPGRVTFGEKLNDFPKDWLIRLVLSTTLGLVLWAFQGIVFGYLHLRFLTYLYIVAFLFFWIRHNRKKIHISNNAKLSLKKILLKNIPLILLFVIGIFGQNQQFIITAFEFSDGIRGFTGSLDDTFWHTGLIESLVRNFPPIEPGMSGLEVHNYHYWSNVVIAELVRIFHLPLLSTQYLYMGILVSFLLGSLAYVLGKQLGFGKMGIFVFVYLQYFSSDVIYLLTFITRQLFIFTIHPLEDGSMLLENTPRAFSFIILFLGIIIVKEWMKSKDKKLGLLIVLIFGCLIGFKVHTGAMGLAGVAALCTYLVYKKNFKDLYIGISIVLALIIYLPVNAGAGGALFVPFEMTSRNFVVQEGLSLSRLELARRIYSDHGNFLQEFRMDITMLGIYIISQFGIRVIGLIPFRKTIKKLTFPLWLMLISGVAFTFLFGVLFIQPVAAADIFNSFLAGSFFLSILVAVSFNNWFTGKKKLVQCIFIIVLLVFSLPRWVYKTSTVGAYFRSTSPVISRNELDAMRYLKNQEDKEIVLVLNNGQWDSHFSYVSIFTETNTFLSGQVIMSRHGIDFLDREKVIKDLQSSTNALLLKQLLSKNNISYLYFYGKYSLKIKPEQVDLSRVFDNHTISIYKVTK